MAGAASGPGSGKVVNLRAARKSAARDTARRQGDANAAKFGRSRAQKLSEEDARQRARQHLDAHRRDGEATGAGQGDGEGQDEGQGKGQDRGHGDG